MDGSKLYHLLLREKYEREDGWLAELVSEKFDDEPFDCIHSYIVTIQPGYTRARHYHRKKEEWFAIAAGKVEIRLKDITTGESASLELDSSGSTYALVHVPACVAHALTNNDNRTASVVVFCRNPENVEDTYSCDV
jgi:dTDP-4-dehydrorhamnose 3,5-epimerase-like enzyme